LTKVANISRSSYYAWTKWSPSENDKFNEGLIPFIKNTFKRSKNAAGVESMFLHVNHMLKKQFKDEVSYNRVRRLMVDVLGLHSVNRKPKYVYQNKTENFFADNTLNREFNPPDVDLTWVTDFTFLKYNHGRNHIWLSGVLDLYSREIVAWKTCDSQTAKAAVETFEMAYESHPGKTPRVHSDRGSCYTAKLFHDMLEGHDSKQSMSNPGTPHDNAVMESWWSLFKTDWFNKTANELKKLPEVLALIEDGIQYFNNERRTKRSNGLTPSEMRELVA